MLSKKKSNFYTYYLTLAPKPSYIHTTWH